MTDSPSVTWPSPARTTLPSRRTDKTVVDRIRRFVGMSAISDYNSAGSGGPQQAHRLLIYCSRDSLRLRSGQAFSPPEGGSAKMTPFDRAASLQNQQHLH